MAWGTLRKYCYAGPRAFESARIKTRPFRLDDPQGHHCSAFWASRALDTVYEHCVSPIGTLIRGKSTPRRFRRRSISVGRNDCATFVACRGAQTIGITLRKSFVPKVTDVCAVITNREFLIRAQNTAQSATFGRPVATQKNDICAMSRRAPELNRLPKVWNPSP
jgi:hypothetical protein